MSEDLRRRREIYDSFYRLVRKVENESPLLSNVSVGLSLVSKLHSLEIMQRYTIRNARNLFASYEREKNEPVIFPKDVNKYINEAIAFFEAYLNAFYSLFQIIGKITPYFYDRKKFEKKVPDEYFERQKSYFSLHKNIDADYARYLENSMKWYDDLVCNRHAISHNASAFLGFGKQEIEFIHMPKKRIDYFENGKPTKKLIEYIQANWISLFDYLDFYVKHFSDYKLFVEKDQELKTVQKLISQNAPIP